MDIETASAEDAVSAIGRYIVEQLEHNPEFLDNEHECFNLATIKGVDDIRAEHWNLYVENAATGHSTLKEIGNMQR